MSTDECIRHSSAFLFYDDNYKINLNKDKLMKTDKIFLTEGYAVPTVERIDIAVEQGFATSPGDVDVEIEEREF